MALQSTQLRHTFMGIMARELRRVCRNVSFLWGQTAALEFDVAAPERRNSRTRSVIYVELGERMLFDVVLHRVLSNGSSPKQ